MNDGKIVPKSRKFFASATECTHTWNGIQQDITRCEQHKVIYEVTALVRIFGNNVSIPNVRATLWVQASNLKEHAPCVFLRRPASLLSAFAPLIVVVSGVVACGSICVCQSSVCGCGPCGFAPFAVAPVVRSPSPVTVVWWLGLPVLPFQSQICFSPTATLPRSHAPRFLPVNFLHLHCVICGILCIV
ncbi:uncharacterized protein HKW66_Vig0144700 [Vigna angularis]|uniref:Uncharacterized protein n=1 Tax=Phaseolus angularis TaxID=3914 RepID=A0A8T0KCH5_PHAAN|nr:uncharacterized protein HKW66_Vig0144700 [Vigna angularis]